MIGRAWWGAILGVLNLHPLALSAQGEVREFREVHLGMEVRIAAVGERAVLERAVKMAFARIGELEEMLSDWRPSSELRRLEQVAVGEWCAVSAPLRDVLAIALEVARVTDGAFDPTVGPLTALWREARQTGIPIADAARAEALGRVGYRWVELDTARSRVRFLRPGMRLDLGAVAKGWILDEAMGQIAKGGVGAAMVEAGGDIVVRGAPLGEDGWRIAVPTVRGDTLLVLTSGAVSTSGPSEQWIRGADGLHESHVIVASTGRGLNDGRQVTVIGDRGAIADAVATALTLVDEERGRALARRFGVIYVDLTPRARRR